jgi:AcrR family transcriptional regulator
MLPVSTLLSENMARKADARPYHHGDLKNALIAAGLRVLTEQGVPALNLREVARVAGVSHAAPYRHFPDKQALITAIAIEGFEMLAAALPAADSAPHGSTIDRLAAAGVAYLCFAIDNPAHIRIMFGGDGMRRDDPALYAISKFGLEYLVTHIQIAQATGEIGQADALDTAKSLWAAMHGFALLVIEGQFRAPGEADVAMRAHATALAERCVRSILHGMR